MNLHGVICCVDYADFLAESLPLNQRHFNRLVVVTTPEDVETQRVCDFYDAECLMTDAFASRWGEFHKAKGINAGLQHLGAGPGFPGWALHLDADIVLPPRARTLLDRAELDKAVLYGVDRLRVPSHEAWRAHQALPVIQHNGYHTHAEAFNLIPRFNAWHMRGYAPPGYFQLWHPATSGVHRYPADHTQADRTDVLFGTQWERAQRALLPEFVVYHLESEPHAQGTNWGGRRTVRFGVEPAHPADRKQHRRHRHHKHHRHHEPPEYEPDDDGRDDDD